jgi:aspartyl aminopeptidase
MDYSKLGYETKELSRQHFSAKGVTPKERKKTLDEYLPLLDDLTSLAAPFDVAERVQQIAAERGCVPQDEREEFQDPTAFYAVKERNSNAFCLIAPGDQDYDFKQGINIIVTHIDSPNLRVRAQPTYFESHPEKKFSHPGAYLEIVPNGGILANDWVNKNGVLRGRTYIDGKERRFSVNARIPHTSIHLETEDNEENDFDRVRVFTGATSVHELYKQLGIKSEMDFGPAEIYFYPSTTFTRLGDEYISTYGLDDRACVTPAVLAFLESEPRIPTFVFGLDCEEIGSTGASGRINGFLSSMVGRYVARRTSRDRTLEQLYNAGVLGTIPAICADVGPALSYNEEEHMPHITNLESAKFGFGPFICPSWEGYDSNSIAGPYIHYLQRAFDEEIKGKYQFVGSEFTSGKTQTYGLSHFAQYFTNQHIPMVAVGVPVGDLHRPGGELMHIWDFLRTKQAYQAYILR